MKENVSLEKENSKNKIKTRTKDEEEAEEAFYLKSNTSREIRKNLSKSFYQQLTWDFEQLKRGGIVIL